MSALGRRRGALRSGCTAITLEEIVAMCGAEGAEGVAPEMRSAMMLSALALPSTLELAALMCALSHCGDASEALRIWKRIKRDEQRMNCRVVARFVDGLARACAETKTMWLALLSGCRNHAERDMAHTVKCREWRHARAIRRGCLFHGLGSGAHEAH